MQDRDLYQQLLCLDSPWTVSQVELNTEAEEVLIHVAHPRGTKFCCPECDRRLPCYDHAEERRWRHLDSCQFQTILVARTPRVKCPEHGVKTVSVPWAAGSSRFTLLFERFAIDVLLATQTVTGAMSLLRTTWDETWHILKLAVERGQDRKQARAMPRIGIDEKAFAKRHKYVTLIYDLDHSTVEAISDGNDTQAGIACFSQLSNDQLAAVEAVAMDMSAAYVKAAMETIPDAQTKIVHDRFHVMQLATKAVDAVRRGEHRELKADGDNRLAKTKYLWLTNKENLTGKQADRLAAVFHKTLNTGKAWGYKELLRDLWDQPDAATATGYFKAWYRRVIHTKLTPLKKLARTIKQRLANVVSYCTHHITNSVAEGMNSKIMSIKRRVGGYRNRENFKTAIFFHCGGLDLYPR
jgi:transposase